MLEYLSSRFGERATIGDKMNLINMRNEVKRLEALLAEKKAKGDNKEDERSDKEGRGSENETEESVSNPKSFANQTLNRKKTTT